MLLLLISRSIAHHLRKKFQLLAVMTMTAFSISAVAANDEQTALPPGIASCGDEAVITAYRYAFTEKAWLSEYGTDSEIVAQWIIANKKSPTNLPKIADKTPFTEPCYYFTAAKLGMLGETPRTKAIEEHNTGLAYFKKGLYRYFARWVSHDYGGSSIETTERDIVINLHRAVLSAATTSSGKLNSINDDFRFFKQSSPREKKQYFYALSTNLKSQFDKYLLKLNDTSSQEFDKNRMLVAQWSAFLLASHYENMEQKDELEGVQKYWIKTLTTLGEKDLGDNGVNRLALHSEKGMSAYGLQ